MCNCISLPTTYLCRKARIKVVIFIIYIMYIIIQEQVLIILTFVRVLKQISNYLSDLVYLINNQSTCSSTVPSLHGMGSIDGCLIVVLPALVLVEIERMCNQIFMATLWLVNKCVTWRPRGCGRDVVGVVTVGYIQFIQTFIIQCHRATWPIKGIKHKNG